MKTLTFDEETGELIPKKITEKIPFLSEDDNIKYLKCKDFQHQLDELINEFKKKHPSSFRACIHLSDSSKTTWEDFMRLGEKVIELHNKFSSNDTH